MNDDENDDLATCINCGKPSKRDAQNRNFTGLCERHFQNAYSVQFAPVGDGAGPHHLTQEHHIQSIAIDSG